MERNRSVATLLIVSGHPCLDLANTVCGRDGGAARDLLGGYGDLVDWAERSGLVDAAEAMALHAEAGMHSGRASEALAAAKSVREATYRVFSAKAAGASAIPDDLHLLARRAGRAQADRRLIPTESSGQYGWQWPPAVLDSIADRAAHGAAALLTGENLTTESSGKDCLVKECPGRNCGWLFLDTTRNHRRRWCSEIDCGTPERVRRHRAQRRS